MEKLLPALALQNCISITVYDYVVRDIGIFVTQKIHELLAEMYDDLNQESIELGVNLSYNF